MALDKAALKTKITAIMTDMLSRENTSIDEFAQRLSDAVDEYVKGAEINYAGGLGNQAGAVTGIFNGGLK